MDFNKQRLDQCHNQTIHSVDFLFKRLLPVT